jgi:hypothetical protein
LGNEEVGALVTLDRSYDLLEELIPTSWRAEVGQVAASYGEDSIDARVLKVVALCAEVPALPLTAANIAVLLHPSVAAENMRPEVTAALARLVNDDRLRESAEGYKLQSPEQKDWEQARRAIDLTQGASIRLRRLLLKQALAGLSVARERTFKVEVTVDGEIVIPGDLQLHIDDADTARREIIRAGSRERANENRITWTYELSPDTWNALVELYRSRSMIERRDTASKSTAEIELLGEERDRERRQESAAVTALARNLAAGQVVFRGRVDDVDTGDLKAMTQRLIGDRLHEIYPRLAEFTANIRREDVLHLLRTVDLRTVAESLRDDGIGLVSVTPTGYKLVTDDGPLAAIVTEIKARASSGYESTGDYLERHFTDPPYGASVEVVQALCAAGVRAGLIEVIYQGQPIRNPADQRLDQVFTTLPRFRASAFRPPAGGDVTLEKRVALAEKLEQFGHMPAGHSTDALAHAVRQVFLPEREATVRVEAALTGLGLAVPHSVTRTSDLLDRISADSDADAVTAAHDAWADLVTGISDVTRLDELLKTRIEDLRQAQQEARRSSDDLTPHLSVEHDELRDLLAAGDLAGHAARIIAIANHLADARRVATADAAARLSTTLQEVRTRLREEYGEDQTVTEALRPLDALEPPNDLSAVEAATLDARADSARARAITAGRQLEELRSARRIAWIRVSDLVPDPITDESEIKPALDRIRDAIADQLADDKNVRLQ